MRRLLIITQKVDEQDQLLGFFISWIQKFTLHFDKVLVLCLQKGTYPDLGGNVEVWSMGKERGSDKITQLISFFKFVIRRRGDYDCVLIHMNPVWAGLGGPIWKIVGKRAYLWYTHKSVTFKLRLAHLFVDQVFTASAESFRLPSRKVMVTGHGIDTDVFKPKTDQGSSPLVSGQQKLLSVGRIAPVKNYEVLIDAAKILADEGFNFKISIVGEPALESDIVYAEKIKSKVKHLGLNEIVSFLGKKQGADLVEQYQSHNLFVHMSKTGSLDKTILEAMACGMNVVSSNDAARAFLPPHLIVPENDPFALAQVIRSTASTPPNPVLRQYVIEHHNLDALIRKIADVINL